ncbi:MAG TPA: hypothetical protein VK142_10425 [Bacillota bacterium]|nr:hypothetical protein [Bacillota bacterium]
MGNNNGKDKQFDSSPRPLVKNTDMAPGRVAGGLRLGGLLNNQF